MTEDTRLSGQRPRILLSIHDTTCRMNTSMFVAVPLSLVPQGNATGPDGCRACSWNTESEEYTAFTAYLLPVLKVTNNINSGKYPGKTVVRPYSLGTPSKPCGRRRGARELACLVWQLAFPMLCSVLSMYASLVLSVNWCLVWARPLFKSLRTSHSLSATCQS